MEWEPMGSQWGWGRGRRVQQVAPWIEVSACKHAYLAAQGRLLVFARTRRSLHTQSLQLQLLVRPWGAGDMWQAVALMLPSKHQCCAAHLLCHVRQARLQPVVVGAHKLQGGPRSGQLLPRGSVCGFEAAAARRLCHRLLQRQQRMWRRTGLGPCAWGGR